MLPLFIARRNKFTREPILGYTRKGRIQGRTWPPGMCQVGRLVHQQGGLPLQMLKDRVEQRREPLAREGGLSLNKLFAAPPPSS